MTHVTLNKSNERYSIEAIGHAKGSVQACAAVSAIMHSALGYLSNVDGVLIDVADFTDGFFSICFEGGAEAEFTYDFCTVAFLQLELSYGEYISVVREEK
jgi:uncharacterized protein YsxB (DUF464 family)